MTIGAIKIGIKTGAFPGLFPDAGVDADVEVRNIGIANVVASLAGAQGTAYSFSALKVAQQLGASPRGVGILVPALCLLTWVQGFGPLRHVPRFVYGALLLDLGELSLGEVEADPDAPPRGLDEDGRRAWRLLWRDAGTGEREYDRSALAAAGGLGLGSVVPAVPGHAYVLRMISPGEHDHLVAFEVLEQDLQGATLLWRRLRDWPIQGAVRSGGSVDPHWWLPPAPAWLGELVVPARVRLLERVRSRAEELLLSVPPALRQEHAEFLSRPDTGIARILHRGRYDPLLSMRGGGSYYSFTRQDHDYDGEPDLSLSQGSYRSGFAGGDRGFLADLGSLPVEDAAALAEGLPEHLTPWQRQAVEVLWGLETRPDPGRAGQLEIDTADLRDARDLGLDRGLPALVGRTYLLRSVLLDQRDVLVAFRPVAEDAHGQTILWQLLEERSAD